MTDVAGNGPARAEDVARLREVGHGEMGLYMDYQRRFAREQMGMDQAGAEAHALTQARNLAGSYEFAGLANGLDEVELVRNTRLRDTQLHELVGKYADSLGATPEQRATLMKHFGDRAHGVTTEQWREHQSKGTGPISDMNRMYRAAEAYRQGFSDRLAAAGLDPNEIQAGWQREAGRPDSLVARMLDGRVQGASVIRTGMAGLEEIGARAEYAKYQEGFARDRLGYDPQQAAEYARARVDMLNQSPDLAGQSPPAPEYAAKLIRATLAREQVLHSKLNDYADALSATTEQRTALMGKYAGITDGISESQWQEHVQKGTGPLRIVDDMTRDTVAGREAYLIIQRLAGKNESGAQAEWGKRVDQLIRGESQPEVTAPVDKSFKAGERVQIATDAAPPPGTALASDKSAAAPGTIDKDNRVNPTSGPEPTEGAGPSVTETTVTSAEIDQAMKRLHAAIMSHREGQMTTILNDAHGHSELSKAYYTARHLAAGGDGVIDANESEAFVAAYEAANGKGTAAIAREEWRKINVGVSNDIARNAELGYESGVGAVVQTNLAVVDKNGDGRLDDDDKERITGFLRQSGIPEEKLDGLLKQVSDAVSHQAWETSGSLDLRGLPTDGPSPLVRNRGRGRD